MKPTEVLLLTMFLIAAATSCTITYVNTQNAVLSAAIDKNTAAIIQLSKKVLK